MQNKLFRFKEDDIYKYQDQISELILGELMARYYYQEGRLIASLMDDIVLKEAISTLHDSVLYQGILSGELNVK